MNFFYSPKCLLVFFCVIVLSACGGGKIKPDPLFSGQSYSDDYHNRVIEVPFKNQGGVRVIQVKINDCAEFPMIFDTGCSGISISVLELATLVKHGYIAEDDIVGITQSQIADGTFVEEAVVNLRKLKIGDYICHDVQATVSRNEGAPLLLGNGALKDVESFSVDEGARVIRFYLR